MNVLHNPNPTQNPIPIFKIIPTPYSTNSSLLHQRIDALLSTSFNANTHKNLCLDRVHTLVNTHAISAPKHIRLFDTMKCRCVMHLMKFHNAQVVVSPHLCAIRNTCPASRLAHLHLTRISGAHIHTHTHVYNILPTGRRKSANRHSQRRFILFHFVIWQRDPVANSLDFFCLFVHLSSCANSSTKASVKIMILVFVNANASLNYHKRTFCSGAIHPLVIKYFSLSSTTLRMSSTLQ